MANCRTKFNWAALDRESIAKTFRDICSEITETTLPAQKLHSLFSKNLKKKYPLKIVKIYDTKISKGRIFIGGSYFGESDKHKIKCIELNFNYRSSTEKVHLSRSKVKRMSYVLADTILHEVIHMRQYRRRKFKYLPDYESTAERRDQRLEQSYLGCTDEIDAYSFNIACELMDKFQNQKSASRYLAKTHHRGNLKSISLQMYLKAFDHNHIHPIIKKLKKRVIMYLPKAELGRPYLTKDWIDR